MRPNPHIALIYHYDLARALAGEVVDWQAIPVNVDAGREGGDLCRAAADFAKRRDLFAMPAPTIGAPCSDTTRSATSTAAKEPTNYSDSTSNLAATTPARSSTSTTSTTPSSMLSGSTSPSTTEPTSATPPINKSAVPVAPNAAVEQQAADPEPQPSAGVPGTATNNPAGNRVALPLQPFNRDRLRARIADLIACDEVDGRNERETLIRRHWPEGVPTLKHDGHSDAQLQLILACVRRVEAEVGATFHPDDSPGLHSRQAIDRALQAWRESGRSQDDLWFSVSLIATLRQLRNEDATIASIVAQFTIEQADRLYDAAQTQ